MGVVLGQSLALSATTNDYAGITWSIDSKNGSLSSTTSTSGNPVNFVAKMAPGAYTITATSMTDATQAASAVIGVTDLAGVYTYHNDLTRDGANAQEYTLTPSSVKSGAFGKLFSCPTDGAIYTQPLWVANLQVNGQSHNVVFVATQHDSLYAFDADTTPCAPLWSVSLIDPSHGEAFVEMPVPAGTSGYVVGGGAGDITPEVGVTGTPVIDPASNTLYVVSKSMTAAQPPQFIQRLHAIDATTGAERPGSPVQIVAGYPRPLGGPTIGFDARQQNQRAGLALVNGTVYVGWGSHEDVTPFYGWLIGYTYSGSTFFQRYVFVVSPDGTEGGIWMSGGAPAADSANNLYVSTGNAPFDATNPAPPNDDYGDSFLKLSSQLQVLSYFTPSDQASDAANNYDFGAGGPTMLADLPAGSPITHLAVAGGKDGFVYLLNRDAPGGYGDANAWQKFPAGAQANLQSATPGQGLFSSGAFWNGFLYLAGTNSSLVAYQLSPATGKLSFAGASPKEFGFPGTTVSVSSQGTANGIVWLLDNAGYCTHSAPTCAPTVLHAFDAGAVGNELWNSANQTKDAAGYAVKFTVPTIANGKVYVPTRGNNTGGPTGSTSIAGELDVYGFK